FYQPFYILHTGGAFAVFVVACRLKFTHAHTHTHTHTHTSEVIRRNLTFLKIPGITSFPYLLQ
ncbi:Hypothetical predicted protein, partial [Lynx pardinus]